MSAYRVKDIGLHKVFALSEIIKEKSGIAIKTVRRAYAGEPLTGSVVSCVDNMEARKAIWQAVRNNPLIDAFIDTRMSELMSSVFALRPHDPEDIAYYEDNLYPSTEAMTQMCGEHGIAFVTDVVAARACRQLTLAWSAGSMVRHQYEGYGRKPYLDVIAQE